MIGYRATDEDEDTSHEVVDGVASTREPTLAEQGAAFVDVCRQLRELGVVEVRAGDFRAVWPVERAASTGPSLVRVALGGERAERPKPEPTHEVYEGERPSAEVVAARRGREEIRRLVEGS